MLDVLLDLLIALGWLFAALSPVLMRLLRPGPEERRSHEVSATLLVRTYARAKGRRHGV